MTKNSCQSWFTVVGIGSSAGGPTALERVFGALPVDLPATFVLSQHMPSGFTRPLAERLSSISNLPVNEASHGYMTRVGEALIAPGGHNMEILRGGAVRVEKAPDGATPTPSINVMMKSIARAYGPRSVGVLLTGMLQDGVEGLRAIKESGGITIAQDEASSLVYGMPKAAVEAGVVDVVADISEISTRIADAVEMILARSLTLE